MFRRDFNRVQAQRNQTLPIKETKSRDDTQATTEEIPKPIEATVADTQFSTVMTGTALPVKVEQTLGANANESASGVEQPNKVPF